MDSYTDIFSAQPSILKSENRKSNTKNAISSGQGKPKIDFHGPLVIYQNKDTYGKIEKNDKVTAFQPILTRDDIKMKPTQDKTINTINPSKFEKIENKKMYFFVTPLPPSESISPISNDKTSSTKTLQQTIKSETEVQRHGNTQHSQFIAKYPGISNYPSGSVLDIHKTLPSVSQGQTDPPSVNSQIHLVPYIVPTNSAGKPDYNGLPPGFSLEQILNEFHENSKPKSKVPSLVDPPFIGNTGLVIQQESGSFIAENHNKSHKG